MKIRIADLNIEIENRFSYLPRFCRRFAAEFSQPDLSVRVDDADLAAERVLAPHEKDDGRLESVAAYRKIALAMPRFDGFLFHACVVECDGRAYAFAAPSGTGKSTHAALWLRVFGDRARILNGDKPLLRRKNGAWIAYGTPWCGKEGQTANASAPLAGICFLERGSENRIAPLDDAAAVPRLFGQIILPNDPEQAAQMLGLLDQAVKEVPLYLLRCNMDPVAAKVAYEGMKRE